MINKILNSTLNQASFSLSDAKDKILITAKKRAEEEAMSQIPSPQDFKNQLTSLAIDSPNALQKAEQTYNKFRNIITNSIRKLEDLKKELQSTKDKLTEIDEKFTKLNNIVGPESAIGQLIPVLRTLPSVLDGVLAFSSGPAASGTVINKAGELKKEIKDNIKKFDSAISSIPSSVKFFEEKTSVLLPPIDTGINNIQIPIDQLNLLLNQLDTIWANFILSLDLPELGDTTTGDNDSNISLAGTTLQEYVKKPSNLSTIVTDVIIPSYKTYYEIRKNGPGTELLETGVLETPINQNI